MLELAIVGGVREQRAVLHELEARGRHLALDRRRVDAVQRRRVAPARAGLGVVIDDEIDAAGLQRREDLLFMSAVSTLSLALARFKS